MKKRKIIENTICFLIVGTIMISTLYLTYMYLYDEPEEVRARADEICMNYKGWNSAQITRSIGSPDEWYFNCADFTWVIHSPISEKSLNISSKEGKNK